jgi:hypothetical protein
MFPNRLTFGVLVLACVAAAGAGGYFASRQNVAQSTPVAAAAPPASEIDGRIQPVNESEAVVDDGLPKVPAAADGNGRSAPAKTATPKRADVARPTTSSAPRSARSETGQALPTLDRSWPSGAASQPPNSSTATGTSSSETTSSDPIAATPVVEPRTAPEISSTPEPPEKVLEEIVVSANSVIGLQTENRISSETARVEDRVEARVTRDVKVGESIAIPAGARAIGSVTVVERGGKFKQQARLGIRFTTLVLADGTRLPMNTETIYRDGEAPSNSSATKIGGGAVGGAILGAILGGAKGAAIGATAGAGGGAAAVQLGDRSEVTVPAGSPMTVRLSGPLTVTVER